MILTLVAFSPVLVIVTVLSAVNVSFVGESKNMFTVEGVTEIADDAPAHSIVDVVIIIIIPAHIRSAIAIIRFFPFIILSYHHPVLIPSPYPITQ